MIDPCPLCRSEDADLVAAVPYEQVWSAWEHELGAPVPSSVRRAHEPDPDAGLVRCAVCGLEYFSPMNAGDPSFYEFLVSTAGYYESRTWDFGRALDAIGTAGSVLDVGCGRGEFLAVASAHGITATGIDTNPAGIDEARRRGLDAECADVSEFASANEGRFDAASMLQVVEHLDDVVPFVTAGVGCVRPGGTVIVSVPNRLRVRVAGIDPFDFPPHHVSRWSRRQLEELGSRCGLDVVEIEEQTRTPWTLARSAPVVLRNMVRRPHVAARGAVRPPTGTSGMLTRIRALRYDHTLFGTFRRR